MGEQRAGMVRLDDIRAHPSNIRRNLGDLRHLADSIRQHGILTPVILERHGPALQIRDGHRRVAAAHMAGLERVPAIVHVHELDLDEWLTQAVVVNNQRRGQTAAERADSARRMVALGVTRRAIAEAYEVAERSVNRWLAGPVAPRPPRPRSTVGRRLLVEFIARWRTAADDQTVGEVLDDLEHLIGGQDG